MFGQSWTTSSHVRQRLTATSTTYWQGVELTVDARPRNGLTLQGGVHHRRRLRATTARSPPKLPGAAASCSAPSSRCRSCHVGRAVAGGTGAAWSTTCSRRSTCRSAGILRSHAEHRGDQRPRVERRVSWPGNLIVPNARSIAPALGRPLAGNAAERRPSTWRCRATYPERHQHGGHAILEDPRALRRDRAANVGIDLSTTCSPRINGVPPSTGPTARLNTTAHSTRHDVDFQTRSALQPRRRGFREALRASGFAGPAVHTAGP